MSSPLTRLAHLIQAAQASGQYIQKSKKYLKIGMKPPNGVRIYDGKRGGKYYLTEEVSGPKKRLPAFRKDNDGSLHHSVKGGDYRITHSEGQHHLHFHGSDGSIRHLGSVSGEPLKALKELKGIVRDHKERKDPAPVEKRRLCKQGIELMDNITLKHHQNYSGSPAMAA